MIIETKDWLSQKLIKIDKPFAKLAKRQEMKVKINKLEIKW